MTSPPGKLSARRGPRQWSSTPSGGAVYLAVDIDGSSWMRWPIIAGLLGLMSEAIGVNMIRKARADARNRPLAGR